MQHGRPTDIPKQHLAIAAAADEWWKLVVIQVAQRIAAVGSLLVANPTDAHEPRA